MHHSTHHLKQPQQTGSDMCIVEGREAENLSQLEPSAIANHVWETCKPGESIVLRTPTVSARRVQLMRVHLQSEKESEAESFGEPVPMTSKGSGSKGSGSKGSGSKGSGSKVHLEDGSRRCSGNLGKGRESKTSLSDEDCVCDEEDEEDEEGKDEEEEDGNGGEEEDEMEEEDECDTEYHSN